MVDRGWVACWTADSARAILHTEALEGDDAIFLATHSPVHGFRVAGSHADQVPDSTEEGLLLALSDRAQRHIFCVVQGEPGSGKSHLIRWLSVNWARENDVVLLLQRADGSLDGALSQLKKRLPSEFTKLFDGLGQRQKAAIEGRAADFLASLGNRMAPDFFETNPFDDSAWCAEHDVKSLLLDSQVRRGWSGPRRILEVMDGKAGQRNSESASFELRDVLELAKVAGDVSDSGPAQRLARQLQKEALAVEDAQHLGVRLEEFEIQRQGDLRTSLTLARALNLRRNDAVQHVIGITAARLKELFEAVRAGLGSRGQRLVLLLEDITSWEGLDDSLIDALVLNANTRDDGLCPLISVVGVTPRYYDQLAGNYRQRITHDIRLGEAHGALQDVATMRGAEDRSAFVSRYLAAARAGTAALRSWRVDFKSQRDLAPPNKCAECPLLVPCHRTFGAVAEVGLFPFTRDAVTGFFEALKTDDKGQTHRTPRGLLQYVLAPTLLNPQSFEEDSYPGPEIESWGLDREQLALSGGLRSLLHAQIEAAHDRDRFRRVFALWGDRSSTDVSLDPNGERQLAGVPEGVFTAFGLSWIGGDGQAQVGGANPIEVQYGSEESTGGHPPTPTEELPTTPEPTSTRAPAREPRFVRPSGNERRARGGTNAQWSRLREQVIQARDGAKIPEADIWHAAIAEIMRSLDWRKLGIDRWTWSKLFTVDRTKIEGTGRTNASHFVLPREEVLYHGLEAFAELKVGEPSAEMADYHRRRLARFMCRLEVLARRHAERRLPGLKDGATWNAATPIAQILLVRAWLRRSCSPTGALHLQWRDILSDEREAGADANSRTSLWRDYLNATKDWHDPFREMLRTMVNLPQGTAVSGLADAGTIAAGLIAFRNGNFAITPLSSEEKIDADINELRALIDLTQEYSTKLAALPQLELDLLRNRARELDDALGGISIQNRASRIDAAIGAFQKQLPNQAVQTQQSWHDARNANAALLGSQKACERVQQLVIDLLDSEESLPQGRPNLLEWLAGAPAGDLRVARDLFAAHGKKVTAELLPIVRERVVAGQRTVDLTGIQAAGASLRAAATGAGEVLRHGDM